MKAIRLLLKARHKEPRISFVRGPKPLRLTLKASGLGQLEAGHDVHGVELLEEELAGVGQLHGRHRLRAAAGRGGAERAPRPRIPEAQQAARRAHVHLQT